MQNKAQLGLILVLLTLVINFALTNAQDNPSNAGLSFLKLGAGSRAVGMGEAYTAVANDASSSYWNPAGLIHISGTELMFTHNKWLQDISNEFFGLGFRAGKNAFGICFMSNTVGGIERRVKPSAAPLDVLNAHDIMLGLSFARNLNSDLSYGFTIKYLYQKIYIESSSGIAFDLGLQYQIPFMGLKTGVTFQNFGYMTELREESTKLPQMVRIGLAYQIPSRILQGEFLMATDWMKILGATSHVNLGFEYSFINYFAIRLGYQTGFEDKGIHGGFGLKFKRYRLDYAYVPFTSDLGNSHRISFGIMF
ncbi:MAG: PorV/PorQ family protein [bacterium]|nr:MAG: PorV/PorQ family protein [bacterium]